MTIISVPVKLGTDDPQQNIGIMRRPLVKRHQEVARKRTVGRLFLLV